MRKGVLSGWRRVIVLWIAVIMAASPVFAAAPSQPVNPGSPQGTEQKTGQGAGQRPEQDAAYAQLWEGRFKDLAALKAEAEAMEADAARRSQPLTDTLQSQREEFNRLLGLYQVAHGHPTEQLTLVYQMRRLHARMKTAIQPLEALNQTNQERLNEMERLQKEVSASGQGGVGAFSGDSEQGSARLRAYQRELAATERVVVLAASHFSRTLGPARATLSQLETAVREIETSLPETWVNYYFHPTTFSLSDVSALPDGASDWVSSVTTRAALAVPQDVDDWLHGLRNFLLCLAVMGGIGIFAYRQAGKLPQRWQTASRSIIKGAWVWVALGLSLLVASTNSLGGVYFSFVLLGVLLLIWGIGSLSWKLRLTAKPELIGKPLPFSRLYPPAALGVFFLYADVPVRMLGIIWFIVMAVFVFGVELVNKKHGKSGDLPFLESLLYGCSRYFGLASVIVSLAGYPRLAILLFMFLFAAANLVTLASALTTLLSLLADALFDKDRQPVRNAILQSGVVPAALLLSLLGTAPWQWAVPGASYLIQEAMSANYTVGAASFDFSRLVIIAVLFFIFRAALNLGKTSLSHLPERMPNIERGVIPPLRTLMVYGVWTLFVIIALGLLGVSLTSLAVIAGGLSVGIGFGMQNIFNNLVSGLMLIFGRTILVGDYVQVGATAGTVKDISIRSTTIETGEMALVYVPNSTIMSGQFTNWTRNNRRVRRSVQIGVAYGSDTALVTKLALEAAKKQESILTVPAPTVRLENFGGSSLDFTISVIIDDFSNSADVLAKLRLDILRLFEENGIDIPYPQLDIRLPTAGQTALAEQEENPADPGEKDSTAMMEEGRKPS